MYSRGQALSFLLILFAGLIKPSGDKLVKIFFDFTIGLAVNNLVDEMFFDPTSFGWNETAFGGIVLVITIVRVWLYAKE